MFCIPHFMFNCCTFRRVEGKRTRQAFRALPFSLCVLFTCSIRSAEPTCIKVMFFLLFSRGGVGPMHRMDSLWQSPPTMELRRSINH